MRRLQFAFSNIAGISLPGGGQLLQSRTCVRAVCTYISQGLSDEGHHQLDVLGACAVFSQDPQRGSVNPGNTHTSCSGTSCTALKKLRNLSTEKPGPMTWNNLNSQTQADIFDKNLHYQIKKDDSVGTYCESCTFCSDHTLQYKHVTDILAKSELKRKAH